MNPRRIVANMSVDLKEFYRNKATMFWTIMFPVLFMLLFGFIFQGQGDVVYDLPVQDRDDGMWSHNLTEVLEGTGLFKVIDVDPDTDPDAYIKDEKVNFFLIIPEGYSDDINASIAARFMGVPSNVTTALMVKYDPSVSSTQAKAQILTSIIGGINKAISGAEDTIVFEMETTVSDQFESVDFFAPGIIGMSVMATSLFGTVFINTELRQKGVLRKLATTPLTRGEWLSGNIIYQLVMATISTAAILLVGILVFNISFDINIFLPVFVILNVFSFTGIGMLITRVVKEAEAANAAANAVMFPMMFLAGTFFPLEMMPDFLQAIGRIFPLYYVNEGLRDAMIYGNMEEALLYAGVIGVFGLVVFIMGIFLTSWKDE